MLRYCLFIVLLATSCKRYEDPAAFTDPRIKELYCNDPSAVNYNWNFPGIPDNSTCIYPSDVFEGLYKYYDTTLDATLNVVSTDSFTLSFVKVDSTKMILNGFCGNNPLSLHANRILRFTIDSLMGEGQIHCNPLDTITGGGFKQAFSDNLHIFLNYEILSDTGRTKHKGKGTKL